MVKSKPKEMYEYTFYSVSDQAIVSTVSISSSQRVLNHYTAFQQHFGSDVTSARPLRSTDGAGAEPPPTRAARRYASAA